MPPWQEELLQLNTDLGRLTPADVVEFAKDKSTAIHKQFQWDDTIAGNRYRLDQARHFIRSVKIQVVQDPASSKPIAIRAFSHVPSDGVGVYRATEIIIQHKRDELLEEISRAIRSWVMKHRAILSVADIRRVVQVELDNLFEGLDETA